MNGRILSEEEIQAVSEHYEWDNFDDDAQATIHDLIATIRDLQQQLKQSQHSHLTDVKAYIDLKQQIVDREKLLCIEKQSTRSLSLMVDRAKEAIEERDNMIKILQSELNDSKYAERYAVEAGKQNMSVIETLEYVREYISGCEYCSEALPKVDEALAKIDNV